MITTNKIIMKHVYYYKIKYNCIHTDMPIEALVCERIAAKQGKQCSCTPSIQPIGPKPAAQQTQQGLGSFILSATRTASTHGIHITKQPVKYILIIKIFILIDNTTTFKKQRLQQNTIPQIMERLLLLLLRMSKTTLYYSHFEHKLYLYYQKTIR